MLPDKARNKNTHTRTHTTLHLLCCIASISLSLSQAKNKIRLHLLAVFKNVIAIFIPGGYTSHYFCFSSQSPSNARFHLCTHLKHARNANTSPTLKIPFTSVPISLSLSFTHSRAGTERNYKWQLNYSK